MPIIDRLQRLYDRRIELKRIEALLAADPEQEIVSALIGNDSIRNFRAIARSVKRTASADLENR